ncbi:MAG: IS3 family transposase [Phycisphaerae bacterium]
MRYQFIQDHLDQWPVSVMCRVLLVSRSGYYAWKARPISAQAIQRTDLISEIHAIHSDREMHVYGSPRVYRELLNRGYEVCENTVAKLMSSEGIASSTVKQFRVLTTDSRHSLPVAENILDRDFTAEGPGQKVVSDLTYIATAEGFLYLVCMIDVFSRRVIGWSMSHEMTTDVFLSALEMAVGRLGVKDNLLLHSDRGSQYCSAAFQAALARHEIRCSMSRKGNCWDNAVSESFFASLKKELVYQQRYATRDEARQAIFQWIETFYNRTRLHSHLGYMSPEQFEQQS